MSDPIVQLRGVLEARIGETPHDAARRLRRERDAALTALLGERGTWVRDRTEAGGADEIRAFGVAHRELMIEESDAAQKQIDALVRARDEAERQRDAWKDAHASTLRNASTLCDGLTTIAAERDAALAALAELREAATEALRASKGGDLASPGEAPETCGACRSCRSPLGVVYCGASSGRGLEPRGVDPSKPPPGWCPYGYHETSRLKAP